MKGFRDTTKMTAGHHFAKGGHTLQARFGKMSNAPGRGAGPDTINGLTARGKPNDPGTLGHAAVNRKVPSTTTEAQAGSKSSLIPGYKKGGNAGKHFHVHKHYYSGGKVKTVSKSYLKKMEMQSEKQHKGVQNDAAATGGTINKVRRGGKMRKATGGTINCRATGGTINKLATGGTQNKLANGGRHIQKDLSMIAPNYGAGGALYSKGGRR